MTTRIAVESDWPRICELMREHARNSGVPEHLALPPSLNAAVWTVAEHNGRVVCALAHGPRPAQICLLWNPGRAETLGAMALMRKASELARVSRSGAWFVTIAEPKPAALAAFKRFGFRQIRVELDEFNMRWALWQSDLLGEVA